jgi:O-antigen ligase
MWSKLFVVWVSFLPFIVWPWMFEGAKVLWFLTGGFFLTIFWLIKLRDKLSKIITKIDFWYFSWLFVLLISSIFGLHPLDSIIGGSYRHQGVLFFFTLWLVGKTITILSKKDKKLLIKGIGAGVIIESLIVIVQRPLDILFSFPMIVNGRPLGTFGEPNAVAGFLAVGASFLSKFTPLLLVLVAILATQSRTGMLSFFIVALGLFVINRKKIANWLTKEKIIVAIFLLAVLVVSGFVVKSAFMRRPASVFEDRGMYWKLGWKAVSERPLLGYGAESGEVVYDMAYATVNLPLYELIVDRSHNLFLDVAIWSGFIGLVLFLGWILTASNNLVKQGKWINIVGGLAWFVFSMFQPLGVVHWILLFLILNF